jgi:hypothetical protein
MGVPKQHATIQYNHTPIPDVDDIIVKDLTWLQKKITGLKRKTGASQK